ncbi:MAG TPA: SH3 domain-containing protein, partial [Thermomicrobiales bacterium]
AFVATDRVNTELPVNFRAGPGTTYAAQGALQPGTLLEATGNAQTVDGVTWRQFRIANGTVGWIRAQDVLTLQ